MSPIISEPTPSPCLVIESAFSAFNPSVHRVAGIALASVIAWVKDAYAGEGRGLLLWSSASYKRPDPKDATKTITVNGWGYGNGKTLLARLAANALYATLTISTPGGDLPDRTGVFTTSEKYKDDITASYDSHTTAEVIKSFRRARFVIIDDFGTEYVKPDSLGWWQEQLYKIFNHAYDAGQPFLMTSNMTPDEIQERIGGKNWSRLFGLCGSKGVVNMSEIPDQRRRSA